MIEEIALSDFGYLNLVAIAGIFLIGMPHGSFDGAIAMHLGIADKPKKMMTFLVSYVLLTALVVATWMLLPALTLILFLYVSSYHFGSRDAISKSGGFHVVESLTLGGLVVVAISQFHKQEVDEIFSYLVNGDTSLIWASINLLSLVVILGLIECVTIFEKKPEFSKKAVEILALIAIFALAPPLLGFAIYFCLVHSSRHFSEVFKTLSKTISAQRIQLQALVLTGLTWTAGIVAFFLFADVANPGPAILRITFIGLAGLTVPHMLLVDGLMSNPMKSTELRQIE